MSSAWSRNGGITNGENLEPVIEITAEELIAHHLRQIPVGCRHQPHVDGDGACASQSLEGLLLESAEQLRLKIQGDVTHFVQKQGAAMRHFKLAHLLPQGAGEGPSLVSEELAFEYSAWGSPRNSS